MDNKEKQIEEMARIIAFDLCDYGKQHSYVYGDKAKCYSSENFSECIKIKNVVDKLYEQGYRKIDEGSVVFTQEEYLRMVVEERALDKASEEKARKQAVKEFIQAIKKDANITYHSDEVTTFAYVDIDDIRHIAIDKFGVEL